MTKVETYLIQRGIKTKNGRAFTRFTIKNILENPVYMVADEGAFKGVAKFLYAQENPYACIAKAV